MKNTNKNNVFTKLFGKLGIYKALLNVINFVVENNFCSRIIAKPHCWNASDNIDCSLRVDEREFQFKFFLEDINELI